MQIPSSQDTALLIAETNLPNDIIKKYTNEPESVSVVFNDGMVPKSGLLCTKTSLYSHFKLDRSDVLLVHSDLASLDVKQWTEILNTVKRLDLSESQTDLNLTVAYMFSKDRNLLGKVSERTIQQKLLQIVFRDKSQDLKATDERLPVICQPKTTTFDFNLFNSLLKTNQIGRSVIHSQVVNSSFDVVDGNFFHHGLAVVVDRQRAGRGRGGNKWISPVGCAMFSLQLEFDLNGKVAKKLPLLQHLFGLAAVHGICSTYPGLNLKLKWPNDIYAPNGVKLGGVVVYSSIFRQKVQINAGMGVNLSNEDPTLCVNRLIQNLGLEHLSREKYLALTFNELEGLFDSIETGNVKKIRDLYHKYWLHQDQEVKVTDKSMNCEIGIVHSIDDDGFLLVKLTDGQMLSVHPDGNSFDMLQGLVSPKEFRSAT